MANSVAARPVAFADGVTVGAGDLRRQLLGSIYRNPGIVTGLSVSALPTPAMKVRLAAGTLLVADGQGGHYPLVLDNQTDLDIAASDATFPRIDLVVGRVVDVGTASSTFTFEILTGTPASSPVPPATPVGSLVETLAQVRVNAGVTSIGSGDITDVSELALVVPRPVASEQVAQPPFNVTGTYVDFLASAWPPITVVVPPSGMLRITVSANIQNNNSPNSTVWATWRISGDDTVADQDAAGLSTAGTNDTPGSGGDRLNGSKTRLVTGLTPGGVVTVTPQWNISSGSAATASISSGQLIVEPVP